jgi:hypothetical protein
VFESQQLSIVLNNLMILSDESICLAAAQRHTNKEDGNSF